MNRGTALKWIELLKQMPSEKYLSGQLRCKNWFSPLGVLANFLDPNGWVLNNSGEWGNWAFINLKTGKIFYPYDGIFGYNFHGETFKLPNEYRKMCKMKTEYGDFVNENGHSWNIDDCNSYKDTIYYIEKYYEQI